VTPKEDPKGGLNRKTPEEDPRVGPKPEITLTLAWEKDS